MNAVLKSAKKAVAKRDLFAEISEGFVALANSRGGKQTLKTHSVTFKPAPALTPVELKKLRNKLELSQPLFANMLRTNVSTLKNWEQGKAKPNAQAALLIGLVKRYPDTVKKLAMV